MSAWFMEGVFSPAGIRHTRAEVAAMEQETELFLLDFELNLVLKDNVVTFDVKEGDPGPP